MSRNPAAKGKADGNHKAIADAIRILGYPVMDLSAAGNGVEDLLVALTFTELPVEGFGHTHRVKGWLLVEAKVPRNKAGTVQPSQYKPAQKEWREKTAGWPRITAVSAQDAVDQIREMTR